MLARQDKGPKAPALQPASLAKSARARGVMVLDQYVWNDDGTLTGFVYGKKGFDDGAVLQTRCASGTSLEQTATSAAPRAANLAVTAAKAPIVPD